MSRTTLTLEFSGGLGYVELGKEGRRKELLEEQPPVT
jgi:hypothetical protein